MPFTDIETGGEPQLQIEQTGVKTFKVLRGFRYTVPGDDTVYVVAKEQDTDLASVPFFLTWFVRSYGRYSLAAVLHDYLWRRRPDVKLKAANRIFRLAMYDLKVPVIRRWIMWAAVSLAALTKTSGLWKARAVLWIAAVLGLDLATVWMLVKGSSGVTAEVFLGLLIATQVLLIPHAVLQLMGVPIVYVLMPAILLILVTQGVYLLVDGVVWVGGKVWSSVARAVGRRAPEPNPLFMSETQLQRTPQSEPPGPSS